MTQRSAISGSGSGFVAVRICLSRNWLHLFFGCSNVVKMLSDTGAEVCRVSDDRYISSGHQL